MKTLKENIMSVEEKHESVKETNWLTENLTENEIQQIKTAALLSFKIELKRIELGMDLKQFAKYMGVTKRKISKWESGKYNFKISSLIDISYKLNLNLLISIK
jgi:DNA-binding transcriptional regulator YiaG